MKINNDKRIYRTLTASLSEAVRKTYALSTTVPKAFAAMVFRGDFVTKSAILLFLGAVAVAVLGNWKRLATVYEELNSPGLGLFWLDISRTLILLLLIVFIWRVVLVILYRPDKSVSDEELPNCTVIVPAYNEGLTVLHTLKSIAVSDYPAEKLQIIAVDDGSVDDTWLWIKWAADLFHGRLETIRLAKNSGKRRALYEGFIRSKGEILVTIDSDSIIQKDTLRLLVSPFVHDCKVGAIAGNVRVQNFRQGIIPRMLEVSFAYSFDFIRASQSMVDTVFCTPGALSAYRKKAFEKNLQTWLNQKFFGKLATIGEDRAMTNIIIRNGWKVKFQSNAHVFTNIPVGYRKLCKMFLRWARSNIRETLIMSTFIFTRFRRTRSTGARINFILSCINLLMPRMLAASFVMLNSHLPQLCLLQLIAGGMLWACLPAAFYTLRNKSSDALYAFAYSVFWIFGLCWITPYAMLTATNGKWLTRDISPKRIKTATNTLEAAATAAA
ncbi:MAG: glycosyltransferase family 2 protein [Sedimentisphaerales bacterium]|nr:glycosyltransferase family 2 protein [Sedimentisphaerales bacterium]